MASDPEGLKKISIYNIVDASLSPFTQTPKDTGDNEATDETVDIEPQWKYRNPSYIIDNVGNLWCFAWYMTSDPTASPPDDPLLGIIKYKMSIDNGENWSEWIELEGMGEDGGESISQVNIQLVLTLDNKIMIFLQNDYGGDASVDPVWLADP